MPYVLHEVRERLKGDPVARCAGDLNFLLTRACLNAIHIEGLSYATLNMIVSALCSAQHSLRAGDLPKSALARDFYFTAVAAKEYVDADEAVGAIECCKLELYRRIIGPYENGAIVRNGDLEEFKRFAS